MHIECISQGCHNLKENAVWAITTQLVAALIIAYGFFSLDLLNSPTISYGLVGAGALFSLGSFLYFFMKGSPIEPEAAIDDTSISNEEKYGKRFSDWLSDPIKSKDPYYICEEQTRIWFEEMTYDQLKNIINYLKSNSTTKSFFENVLQNAFPFGDNREPDISIEKIKLVIDNLKFNDKSLSFLITIWLQNAHDKFPRLAHIYHHNQLSEACEYLASKITKIDHGSHILEILNYFKKWAGISFPMDMPILRRLCEETPRNDS